MHVVEMLIIRMSMTVGDLTFFQIIVINGPPRWLSGRRSYLLSREIGLIPETF